MHAWFLRCPAETASVACAYRMEHHVIEDGNARVGREPGGCGQGWPSASPLTSDTGLPSGVRVLSGWSRLSLPVPDLIAVKVMDQVSAIMGSLWRSWCWLAATTSRSP